MTFNELPISVQERLNKERVEAHISWKANDSYKVRFTNKEGTRCFEATRKVSMNAPYGVVLNSGSIWEIMYYSIVVKNVGSKMCPQYTLTAGKFFGKSANGTEIPRYVGTKKEVLEIAKNIETLEM